MGASRKWPGAIGMMLMEDKSNGVTPPPRQQPLHSQGAARVTLVGAGPGDPELLTLKALRAMQASSLVLYDHLVSQAVLQCLPPHAERIYVGKEASHHTLTQDGIIALMLRLARSGRPVLRLKGGDGYIFGRGGEEALALAEAGVHFEVFPGLSAAHGAAASVGIPLTHRDHAGTLVFTTGHRCGDVDDELDWPVLARPHQTVVIYMGVRSLGRICSQLIAHGRAPDTPAAVVEQATLPGERCLTGSLADLPALAEAESVRAPALIIVGEVVGLQPALAAANRRCARTII
jgi:uroporphyrin-III C-methyltransferase